MSGDMENKVETPEAEGQAESLLTTEEVLVLAEVDLDLDARRAERTQKQKKPKTFRANGVVYEVPADLPLSVVTIMSEGKLAAAFRALLGPEQYASLFEQNLFTNDDLTDLFGVLYGQNPGEAKASRA